MPCGEDNINIAELPTDIIRNIIFVDHHSIESLKLISPRFNTLVNNCLPQINSFRWTEYNGNQFYPRYLSLPNLPSNIIRKIIEVDNKSNASMNLISFHWYGLFNESPRIGSLPGVIYPGNKLCVIFPKKCRNILGVEKWECKKESENAFADMESTRDCFNYKTEMRSAARIFSRCSRICKLEFSNSICEDSRKISVIQNSVHRIFIKEMIITDFKFFSTEGIILNLLRSGSVSRLCLFADKWDDKALGFSFLRQVTALASELVLVLNVCNSNLPLGHIRWEKKEIKEGMRVRARIYWEKIAEELSRTGGVNARIDMRPRKISCRCIGICIVAA